MRVDVMTKMRGVGSFSKLWGRRTTISIDETRQFDLMSIPDLVKAKKTQRDKDWPMVRRLVEVNYFENREHPTAQQIRFWFLELRTPELLIELSSRHGHTPPSLIRKRSLLKLIRPGNETILAEALHAEERSEREADREYWLPLRAELDRCDTRGRPKPQADRVTQQSFATAPSGDAATSCAAAYPTTDRRLRRFGLSSLEA